MKTVEVESGTPCNLITQDIIGAVDFYDTMGHYPIKKGKPGFEAEAEQGMTWKDYAWKSLEDKVNRVKGIFPEAAKRGIHFEQCVQGATKAKDLEASDLFKSVVDSVRGMEFGSKGGINVMIPGIDTPCYIYTKEDAIKLPKIVDLKTTGSYKAGKHLEGWQHKLYVYRWIKQNVPVESFEYVVAEWGEYPKIGAVRRELFYMDVDPLPLKEYLDGLDAYDSFCPVELILEVELKILSFMRRLDELKLLEAYQKTYCLYPYKKGVVYTCEDQTKVGSKFEF